MSSNYKGLRTFLSKGTMLYLPNAEVIDSDLHSLAAGLCLCGLSQKPLTSSGGLCLSLVCHHVWGYTRLITKI